MQKLENKILDYYNNIVMEKYDSALNLYKDGMYLLNSFIDYRNDQFIPDKGDEYLKETIHEIEEAFRNTNIVLDSIEKPNPRTLTLMNQLRKAVDAAMVKVNEQKSFVAKVLDTPKNYRKSLFYIKL